MSRTPAPRGRKLAVPLSGGDLCSELPPGRAPDPANRPGADCDPAAEPPTDRRAARRRIAPAEDMEMGMRRIVLAALLLMVAGSAAAQPCAFSPVSPGDAITAEHMNRILACLEWLASRVDDDDEDDDDDDNGDGGEIPEGWLGDWRGVLTVTTFDGRPYNDGSTGYNMGMTISPSGITWRADHQFFWGSGTARLTASTFPFQHGLRLLGWECEVEVGLVSGGKIGQVGHLLLLAMTTAPGCALSWDGSAVFEFQRQQ